LLNTIRIKGKALKIDWVNPHSHLTFEVSTPDGKTEQWTAETPPPNTLYRAGWRKTMIEGGEELTVNGFLSKDGTNFTWALSLDFADGRKSNSIRSTYATVPVFLLAAAARISF
jgi:hypothetical protein